MRDEIETIDKNPKSWVAWKREAERLQEIIDFKNGELLAYREAQGKAVVVVEEGDYLTVAQMTGKEPRRKAVRELYEGALIVGSKLYAAPQLPAVPDEITPDDVPGLLDQTANPDEYACCVGADMWNKCRTTMLKSASFRETDNSSTKHFRENAETSTNSPVIPDGWALVPIEATTEMLSASWIHHGIHSPSAWRTMVAAAPKPE